ncbi:MAG: hypothetical protein C5B58_09130 [Acidobacteria bacterium]|nr:MAG: hypothetical protein C5B58_09130 [Acidobacteriota bacterium]
MLRDCVEKVTISAHLRTRSDIQRGATVYKKFNVIIFDALFILLLAVSSACSRHPSDSKIVNDIHEKIASDPDTRNSPVMVTSKDGKVVYTGRVRTPAAQKKIEQIARESSGSSEVEDKTAVDPDAFEPLASGMTAAAPPGEIPKPQPIVVPSGTALTVTTSKALSSKTSHAGQTFLATLAQPVSIGGTVALPKGSTVGGTVVRAQAKGKLKGQGELAIALTSISVGDHTYPIETGVLSNIAKGKGKRTAATTGGGAAGGALIGGVAGGGKGAGIGALIGAGAGFIGGAVTGNKQIEIPAESALTFTLTAPLTIPPASQ